MIYCTDPKFQSLFTFYKLSYWKVRILSLITTFPEKQRIIREIEDKARKLASEKNMELVFYIMFQRIQGSEIAHICPLDCAINQAIDIKLDSKYVRSSERFLLVLTFNEYSHMLYFFFNPEIKKEIETLYSKKKIPNWHGVALEDFCDLFGYYIVDKSTGDPELDRFLEEVITYTNHKLLNSRMWKASKMPDHYKDMNWRPW